MSIRVDNPGLVTTVQDLGRPGYFHLGIPIGGAMDRYALRVANLLVGNAEDAAGLEAAFVGPTLHFEDDGIIAVTGADIAVKIDGNEFPTWTAITVKAGQTVSFGHLKGGARPVIAIGGGVDVPEALGSRSTYPIGALGGLEGRPLAKGDILPIGESTSGPQDTTVPDAYQNDNSRTVELRVLPGLYWHRVRNDAQERFYAEEWKVAPEADRMGYRFRGGTPLEFVEREQPFGAGSDPSNIVDGCYPYGSIQVPGGTEPIILHRDAVSGGGYFMIGTIISADMDLIGQMQPHTTTRFRQVSMEEALAARASRAARLEEVRNLLD